MQVSLKPAYLSKASRAGFIALTINGIISQANFSKTNLTATTMTSTSAAEQKLQHIIDQGAKAVSWTYEAIKQEVSGRKDYVVKPSALDYDVNGDTNIILNGSKFYLTPHSRGQLYQMHGMPKQFADRLIGLEERDLVRETLRKLAGHNIDQGAMIRTIGDKAKGFLSTAYKRYDSGLLLDGFIESALSAKLVPYIGRNTDYRQSVTFLYPKVFTPAPNEAVVYGSNLVTGDYGNQKVELNTIVLRIWCTNLAVGYNTFSKVHLGKRFETDEQNTILSDETLSLDAKTVVSAISDAVKASQAEFEVMDSRIRKASQEDGNIKAVLDSMKKKGYGKSVRDEISALYESPVGIESLPQEKSTWRLSNVLSLMANSGKLSADESIDLQIEAGKILPSA